MAKILIVYDSRTGHTEKMASAVAKGVEKTGAEVTVKKANQTTPQDLLAVDGIIMGSPVYFGQMSMNLKRLVDDSVSVFHKLEGKVGGAFASSGGLASGGETTLLSVIEAMLIHGMIVQGKSEGMHYGVSVGDQPTQEDLAECETLGSRVAALTLKLYP
ncbi:MAG: flavodoxin family protein [Candidatus Bathyarchaeia archaeon]|jgi:NAD(P)H dehydrogenase (quinone)